MIPSTHPFKVMWASVQRRVRGPASSVHQGFTGINGQEIICTVHMKEKRDVEGDEAADAKKNLTQGALPTGSKAFRVNKLFLCHFLCGRRSGSGIAIAQIYPRSSSLRSLRLHLQSSRWAQQWGRMRTSLVLSCPANLS